MVPNWPWHRFVHFWGREFRKLLNFFSFLTVDLQIQSSAKFCATFHISGCIRASETIGVYFHIIEIKNHYSSLLYNKNCMRNKQLTFKLIQGHALLYFWCTISCQLLDINTVALYFSELWDFTRLSKYQFVRISCTLSSSFLSLHATSKKIFNSYKTTFLKSHLGWLPTSFLSIPLKLNLYSLVFLYAAR